MTLATGEATNESVASHCSVEYEPEKFQILKTSMSTSDIKYRQTPSTAATATTDSPNDSVEHNFGLESEAEIDEYESKIRELDIIEDTMSQEDDEIEENEKAYGTIEDTDYENDPNLKFEKNKKVNLRSVVPHKLDSNIKDFDNKRKRSTHSKKKESPFEKLNTLKLLYDCGHLTEDEYKERKNQIINEMTGTSSVTRPYTQQLQPIMKTVVPHGPPDFSTIMKEPAEKLCFDVDTLEWNSSPAWIKLDLVPFATGQLRNAYFLQEVYDKDDTINSNSRIKILVAKFCIQPTDSSSYLSDVEMQAVCAHYARLYNEHDPPLKVHYARSWILKLKDRNDLICCVEEYIPGLYVKYSNNNGFVGTETSTTEERERNTPQAFSHFTFVASDYKLMVVDIQGVNDNYTDPQIHSADGHGFGAGNLGTYGMEKFLQSHRCNEVCRWLGLRSLNKKYKPGGTAAPNYRMPHGAIKKSTSRITEERNTFSRSLTVSEVLGETRQGYHDSFLRKYKAAEHDQSNNCIESCILIRMFQCCFTG